MCQKSVAKNSEQRQTGRVRESSRKWQDQDFENMNLAHGTKDRGKHSNEGRAGHVYME